MIKIFLCIVSIIFISPVAFSNPSLFSNQIFLVAQEEEFDDSDLADIEGNSYDDEDEEEIEEKSLKKRGDSKDKKLEKEFNNLEYEIIDDDDSSEEEIIDDDFSEEEDVEADEEDLAQDEDEEDLGSDSKDKALEESLNDLEEDEALEESFESQGGESLKEESIENLEEDLSNELDEAEEVPSFDTIDIAPDESTDDSDASGELNLINNIRFISDKNQIIIDASETTSYKDRRNENNNQLILEIFQSKLSGDLNWPYVLKDFNTNFGMIKADQKTPNTVRVVIQFKEKADFPNIKLSEKENQIIVGYGNLSDSAQIGDGQDNLFGKDGSSQNLEKRQILPAKTLEELYFGKIEFSGKPISFHVIDAPIKQVLRFISEESGLNMVIDEKVQGNVTLKLENIPWDQALYTIFKVKSLGYTRDGNVITILPLTEIEQRTKKLKEIAEQQKPLIPLVTKVIPVTYGKLSEIESKVKNFLTPANTVNKQEGGKIIIHEESNTLIVIDTEKTIEKIEKLITYLDKTPRQVMIEARIVEASENFVRSFGLSWSLGGNLPVTVNANGLVELLSNISGNYRTEVTSEGSGSGVLQLNGIPFIGDVTASLNIAEGENYARIVSSPKVVTISGKKASITRNSPILVSKSVTTTAEGNTTESRETEDVKIQLDVTPTVTSTGSVFLDVSVDRSDPGGAGGALKTTRSAKTEVLVQNGHTIVIGGIYEEDEVNNADGIPFLKNIPILNFFFNKYRKNSSKSELLVFLTPKLLDTNE